MVVHLRGVSLPPVIELEPGTFSTQDRSLPSGSGSELPEEWEGYWRASLADSGISGIDPIRPGSWHVSVSDITTSQLEHILRAIVDGWGGLSSLNAPDARPVLGGGLALRSDEQGIVIEPTCCGDLRNIANWNEAASFAGTQWEMLWIGHPWLSMKFQNSWLLLSDLHESNDPVERWAVMPDELRGAVMEAEAELIRFSEQITSILVAWGCEGDSVGMALELAGLAPQ